MLFEKLESLWGSNEMILLSYYIDRETPAYGGNGGPDITSERSIQAGHSSNSLRLNFSNHTGTHIDCPFHFDSGGEKLSEYSAEFWYCSRVATVVLDPQPLEGALIEFELLRKAIDEQISLSEIVKAEALIVKTGWSELRKDSVYSTAGPGWHRDVADGLRQLMPELRFFAFDLISISSFVHREEGREAHRAFLKHERPILPVEEMDLRSIYRGMKLNNLLISPLLLQDADGAPVTVWANLPAEVQNV